MYVDEPPNISWNIILASALDVLWYQICERKNAYEKNIKYSDIWLVNAITIVPCMTIPQ